MKQNNGPNAHMSSRSTLPAGAAGAGDVGVAAGPRSNKSPPGTPAAYPLAFASDGENWENGSHETEQYEKRIEV